MWCWSPGGQGSSAPTWHDRGSDESCSGTAWPDRCCSGRPVEGDEGRCYIMAVVKRSTKKRGAVMRWSEVKPRISEVLLRARRRGPMVIASQEEYYRKSANESILSEGIYL